VSTNTTDRLDVAELLARLSHLLDEHRYDDIHTVYTDDVVVHSPRAGELHGRDAVTKYLHESHVEGVETHHLNTDVLVAADGDQARAAAHALVHFYRDGEPPHQTSALHVAYTAVRTSVGWRFREARMTLAWTHKG
jgi:ketosteroid isomerase-like protein